MRWKGILREAAVGGVAGVAIVLIFAALQVRSLEDLDHIGSFTVAILTIPLVALSYVLYRETERTRIENSAARIVVTIEPNRYFGFFDVVICNVGRGAAFEIETTFAPDIVVAEDGGDPTSLSENRFISPPVLKPGQESRLYIGRFEEITPQNSTVSVVYKDERGAMQADKNLIDLKIYESFGQLGPDNDIAEISKHVKSIAESLRKVTTIDRLRVDTYDSSDRDRQSDRRVQERRAMRARLAAMNPPVTEQDEEDGPNSGS